MNVTESGNYKRIEQSEKVLDGAGRLIGIFVASASSTPAIKVWDNTSANDFPVVDTFTPVAGTFYPMPFLMTRGIFVTISGTVDCTVSYLGKDS